MDIAHLLVVNCKFYIIIHWTYSMQLHDIATEYSDICNNLVFYYQFIHKHFVY